MNVTDKKVRMQNYLLIEFLKIKLMQTKMKTNNNKIIITLLGHADINHSIFSGHAKEIVIFSLFYYIS